MNNKLYKWINPGFAKGIDPESAIEELKRIEAAYNRLTPDTLLEASVAPDALFHRLFTWDDTTAANNWRLQQARTILNNIEVKVISDGKERNIPVYEVVKTLDGNAYKHIETFNLDDVAHVKGQCVKALNYWKNKLSVYKEFGKVAQRLNELIVELN